MIKYYIFIALAFSIVACKKEPVIPGNPSQPPDTTAPAAIVTLKDTSGNCYTSNVQGNYVTGTALTASNTVIIQVNVLVPGTYTIQTGTINGYKFSASGTFTVTGVQLVLLQGSGIPVNAAIDNFQMTAGSSNCSFIVTVVNSVTSENQDNDNMYFGNPSNAAPLVDSVNNYLMRKTYYSLSYSRDRGTPNWVSWHLYSSDLGNVPRQDNFRPDNFLPAGWYRVPEYAYSLSGFDRGHNTPSGDRSNTIDANSSTFLMTNMIPQAPNHNQVTWAGMEDSLRQLVAHGFEVYIIMGSYGQGGTGSNGYTTTIDGGRVTVPANIWKVAVVIPNGNNDSSRVTADTRIIAVDIPNTNNVNASWKTYRVNVDEIESATRYDLLTRLPVALQAVLEAKVDNL